MTNLAKPHPLGDNLRDISSKDKRPVPNVSVIRRFHCIILVVDGDHNYIISLHKGGVDFVWSATPAVMTLTFDSTNLLTPQCFDVLIIDDALGELEEIFTIALSLQNNSRGQVLLQTSSANISIADNDGKLILIL